MDVPGTLSSMSSYPGSPLFPWSSHGLSSPSPGSASSSKMNREEPERVKKSMIRTETKGTRPCCGIESIKWWWQSTPGTQLFHISYREDGPWLSSQIQSMWSGASAHVETLHHRRRVLTQELWEDLPPGYTISKEMPRNGKNIPTNLMFASHNWQIWNHHERETGDRKICIPHSQTSSSLS